MIWNCLSYLTAWNNSHVSRPAPLLGRYANVQLVHIERSTSLPELVFRFHRKHKQKFELDPQNYRPPRFPQFYSPQDLKHIRNLPVNPIGHDKVQSLTSEQGIWVYTDMPLGHYELLRGNRRYRIRTVSYAPASAGYERVFRGACR